MKKVLLAVCAFLFVSSLCFAQASSTQPAQTSQATDETKSVTGKVESISLGDTAKKTKSQIVVVDDKGQKMTFAVNNNIATYDKNGKATTLSTIAQGNKVAITKNDKNKVDSIKIVE